MDRFDRISQRPVRLSVNLPGFDLDRALKQHQKSRGEKKRLADIASKPNAPAKVDAAISANQVKVDPAIPVETVVFGNANAPDDCSMKPDTPFNMEL